ncbi:suppressor of cytokine signaling 2-like [Branchiostoma floridae]|uniref:Suppressor of cytokine signaling 2-like n=1 Tax=Branchiostoma floridae TaxID=7739 RepID=A0A9J7LPU2_BRAFL|nr:suppressor of cytokine signaling 2-like [Branchiostoma floridae]
MLDSLTIATSTTDVETTGTTKMTVGSAPNGVLVAKRRSSYFDLRRLANTIATLEACGWYWGALTAGQSKAVLRTKEDGAFLVRDSENSAHLFSLSVKTPRGPTSVRIHYTEDGKFRLDSDKKSDTPEFDCVVKLVDYYVKQSEEENAQHFWLEPNGRREVPVKLARPLRGKVPPLQHLCRTVIHKQTSEGEQDKLPLPKPLKSFLAEYPYRL